MMHLLSLYLFSAALQMQYPFPDLLCSPLIPELGADIPAGPPGHIHLALINVAALGTAPDQLPILLGNLDLPVPAAALAVVAFRVQLRLP